MKYFFILTILWNLNLYPNNKNERLLKIINEIGVRTGEYEKETGPKECLEGTLDFVFLENEVSIKLGANLLIYGLGKDQSEESERGCKSKTNIEYNIGWASNEVIISCENIEVLKNKTIVFFSESKLKYSKELVSGSKEVLNINCVLKLIK